MAFQIPSTLRGLTPRLQRCKAAFCAAASAGFRVEHDRNSQRFTLIPDSGAGADDRAVLLYKFTGEREVDLMSTFVPETIRGRGAAALLSQAAMDYLVEENLKARVSCWYIRKYIDEHPQQLYRDRVIS